MNSAPDIQSPIGAALRRWHARWPVRLLLAFLALAGPPHGSGAETGGRKALLVFPEKDVYRQAADAIAQSLRGRGHTVELLPLPVADAESQRRAVETCRAQQPAVIVSGGTALTADMLRDVPGAAVVFFMVPNAADAPFLAESSPDRQRVAGVSSDVAPDQQIEWLQKTAPRVRRASLFHSERTRRTAQAFASAGKSRGIAIELVETSAEKITSATETAEKNGTEGVVMIPDAQVYNATNVQHLLVWAVREKRAVWGFSDKVVHAGALAGIYADPAAVGRQCAELVSQVLNGRSPGELGWKPCSEPRRAVNVHTANLIGAAPDEIRRDSAVEIFGDNP